MRNGPREVTIIETGGALSAFRKLGGTWVFLLEGAGALLSLKDCIVTVDALHCHRAMARSLLEAGGQYVLALKDNQRTLLWAVKRCFAESEEAESLGSETRSSHGRRERRSAKVIADTTLAKRHDFPGIRALAQVRWVRSLDGSGMSREAHAPF